MVRLQQTQLLDKMIEESIVTETMKYLNFGLDNRQTQQMICQKEGCIKHIQIRHKYKERVVELHITWAKRIPITTARWTCQPIIKKQSSNNNHSTTTLWIPSKHKTTEILSNYTIKTNGNKTNDMSTLKFWNNSFGHLREIQPLDFDLENVILTKNNTNVLVHCTNTIILLVDNKPIRCTIDKPIHIKNSRDYEIQGKNSSQKNIHIPSNRNGMSK